MRGYNYPTSHSQSVTHITTDGRTVELLVALGGAAVALPLAARAQQGGQATDHWILGAAID